MPLNVETGTASQNSQSYAAVADADAYFASRGITLWSDLSTTEKEQALVRATDYLTQTYRGKWKGVRVISTQALDWPRAGVCLDGYPVNSDQVPSEVRGACIEMAFRAASGQLLADLGQGVKSKTVGPVSITYDERSSRQKQYAAVDQMLRPLLTSSDASIQLVRA